MFPNRVSTCSEAECVLLLAVGVAQGHGDVMGGGAALNLQLQIRACCRGTHGTVKLVALGHGVTVGFNHDVAGSQACFRGGAVRFYRGIFNAPGMSLDEPEPVSAGLFFTLAPR